MKEVKSKTSKKVVAVIIFIGVAVSLSLNSFSRHLLVVNSTAEAGLCRGLEFLSEEASVACYGVELIERGFPFVVEREYEAQEFLSEPFKSQQLAEGGTVFAILNVLFWVIFMFGLHRLLFIRAVKS